MALVSIVICKILMRPHHPPPPRPPPTIHFKSCWHSSIFVIRFMLSILFSHVRFFLVPMLALRTPNFSSCPDPRRPSALTHTHTNGCCTNDRSKSVLALFVLCVTLWLFAAGLFFMLHPVRCFVDVFSGSCLILCSTGWERWNWMLYFSLICGVYTVCHDLFDIPLGVIGRLYYVIVVLL